MNADAWSTVRVTMPTITADAIPGATAQLDELGALLATREDVGGVETRDPTFITEGVEFVTVERPELIIYTAPPARAAVEARARELAQMLGIEAQVEARDHEGDDWRDAWKRYYRSLYFRAGTIELMIRPSWIPREADDPTCELILDPGRAFGTGLHESTRLCLRALVELAADPELGPPSRVIDLGCGSGILGLAARAIWPEVAQLCFADHDPEAVDTARENHELNAVDGVERALEFRQLSLGPESPEPPLSPAPLVFANIRPMVLIPAAATTIAAVEPGGLLILSGILEEEADEVLAAYPQLELRARPTEQGWCALVLERPAGAEPR